MANQILAGAVFQAGQVIAGVDADNPPYVGPPPPTLIVGAKFNDQTGSLYSYNLMDLSSEPTKITASDGEPWEQFGVSLDISGNVAVVGAYDDDDGGTYAGSVYVYNLLDLSEAPTKLVPSELDDYDDFGLYAATNGNLIAVGARMDDDAAGNAGAVYVYDASNLSAQPTKLIPPSSVDSQYFGSDGLSMDDSSLVVGALGSSTVYVYDVNDLSAQPTALTAFDAAANDGFGKAVAMTSTKIFVGSLNDDDNGQDTGSVYIFDRSDLSAQATKLTAYDSTSQQRFGGTLAVSDNYLYVGAQGYLSNQGRVYAYTLSNLSAQPSQLVAYDGQSGDVYSIGLYASNGFLAVGAYLDDDPNQSGAVYVYDESDLSAQPTKLKPSDIDTSAHFGYAFAIGAATPPVTVSSGSSSSVTSLSPKWLVVGAPNDPDAVGAASGSVYLFDANDLSAQPTKILSPDPNTYDEFGKEVSALGDTFVVGVWGDDDDGSYSGSAYVYDANDLSSPTKLTAFDGSNMDTFGWSNTITTSQIVIGAPKESNEKGSIYVYDRNDLTAQTTKLMAPDAENGDQLSWSVDATDSLIVAGARYDDNTASNNGSAYVWNANDLTSAPTRLTAFDESESEYFGEAVSVSDKHVVVGAWAEDPTNPANGAVVNNGGAVYVFNTSDLSAQATKLTPLDAGSAQPNEYFGRAVSATNDWIVVGARGNNSMNLRRGVIYVYDANDLSAEPTVVHPPGNHHAQRNLYFGSHVDIIGNMIVVGVPSDDTNANDAGAVYVYDASDLSAAPTQLTQYDNMTANGIGGTGDWFGSAVAIGGVE
jgi:uncharacterized protein YciI